MNFDVKKYDVIKEVFEDWWEGKLNRPIIQVTLDKTTSTNGDFFASNYRKIVLDAMYNFDLPVDEAAKVVDKAFDAVIYCGDAIPAFYMRPTGILGGFLGQDFGIDHNLGTVWFKKMCSSIEEMENLPLKESSPLLKRALELTCAVQSYFNGDMPIGFPDFGGVMDIVASIRDANPLLEELYEEEEGVKKACANVHEQFKKAYKLFADVIDESKIPGYTAWATLLSQKEYFVLQNDFSAMIGPQMYDDFYLPILKEECKFIPRTIYHLDGPDAVRHLDSILTIDELNGVQWVQGAGALGLDQWPDIYKKIHAAGKLCQVFINGSKELPYIDYIVNLIGTSKGLCFICTGKAEEKAAFDEYLKKYNCL